MSFDVCSHPGNPTRSRYRTPPSSQKTPQGPPKSISISIATCILISVTLHNFPFLGFVKNGLKSLYSLMSDFFYSHVTYFLVLILEVSKIHYLTAELPLSNPSSENAAICFPIFLVDGHLGCFQFGSVL